MKLLLILSLAAVSAVACQEAPVNPEPVTSPPPQAVERIKKAPRFDPPVVISTAKALKDYDKLKAGDTPENNPITRWAKERLGIVQTNKWLLTGQNEALSTKIKLALSGGEELPDVLFLTQHEIPELLEGLVDSGRFIRMEEAFEAYAPDRVKEAYAKNPDVWKTVSLRGQAWGLPQISDGKVGDPILWIRKDWLARLGLPEPTTLEELEAVLEGFAHRDPDGNGLQDTFGLAIAGKNTLNGWMGDASFVFGAYADQPYQWNRGKDGTLSYGSVQPELKPALMKLRNWYAKGYLHPDFGTHDEQKAVELITSGQAGVISGPGWMGGWPLGEMRKEPDETVMKPLPYPTGPDGRIGRIGSRLSYGAYFFRKGFEQMDAVFAYWDEVYGTFIEDPDSDFAIGFGEGYDYMRKDGDIQYDFPGVTSTLTNYLLFGPGSTPPNIMLGESIENRVYRGQVQSPYEKRLAATSSRLYLEGRIIGDKQLAYSQKNEFVGPYTSTMKRKWPLLETMEKEAFLKIVYGEAPIHALDEFIQMWYRSGGEAITNEVNQWDRDNQPR
ncbi:extracellular solute-binding protein [Paenibacillus silviterrae]|uniref:extracellular solute-binding protein n=1 Tax=Paenibacillus silviterrae TaxID=3242194 RepID=UPI002542DE24|nr:extracellular solute-binding protein [Paenibacillus chinjuensis]